MKLDFKKSSVQMSRSPCYLCQAASKAKRQGLYAELQIATIKLKLGHFREAKVALREILQEDPKVIWFVEFSRKGYKIR